MAKSNYINKPIWLVLTGNYNFTIVAKNEKDCKTLIEEILEDSAPKDIKCNLIGNVAPTSPFFENWEGESHIISTNFYDV